MSNSKINKVWRSKVWRSVVVALMLIGLGGCLPGHIIRWDYIPNGGWRAHQNGRCNLDCIDEVGNILPACQSCYDKNKRLLPGCIPGFWGDAVVACRATYWNDTNKATRCVANWPKVMTPLHEVYQ